MGYFIVLQRIFHMLQFLKYMKNDGDIEKRNKSIKEYWQNLSWILEDLNAQKKGQI